MHYYQHHIGDFIKDTSFLTNEEVGIYMKLIWLYYDAESPLPNDIKVLAIKTNARQNVDGVQRILDMFFVLDGNEWHHTRCDKEIADYADYCNKQKANGAKGGRPKRTQTKPTANPTLTQHEPKITLTTNHYPLTTNQSKDIAPPEGVAVNIWRDYLKVRKAAKKPITETALKGLAREAGKAGITLCDALQICCERNWIGFKAEWLREKQTAHERNMKTLAELTGGIHGEDFSFKPITHNTMPNTIDEELNDRLL